jgi:hypothetical protein
MTGHVRLLPRNATPWMLATAEANDPLAGLGDDFSGIRLAFQNTPPQFMPFLVWQYGLGELSPFLPNLYDLIAEGVRWQRVRGTPAAIYRGLSWLGYSATIEEEPVRRRRWNRFQIELDRVRDNDLPDLRRIDGIVSLSPPERSVFYRGFRVYDVRAAETSCKRLSRSLLSSHSGVRIDAGKAKWSFGRSYAGDALLGEAELDAVGAWVPAVSEGDLWVDADYLWADADFLWALPAAIARRKAIADALVAQTAHIRFRNGAGAVIGYRRAVTRPVSLQTGGEYQIGASTWGVSPDAPTGVVVHARTGFGDGAGQTAAHMDVVLGLDLADGVKPGLLWLSPEQASGGSVLASSSVSIPFGLTVRELCRFSLRF